MKTKIKQIIKLFLPPLFLNLIGKNKQQNTFDGVYENFSKIPRLTDYDSDSSKDDIHYEVLNKLKEYESQESNPVAHNRSQITNLLSLLIGSMSQRQISILDYGGGQGSTFIDCLNSVNMDEVEYYIYDLQETMNMGMKIFSGAVTGTGKGTYDVCFVKDLSKIKSIDIVYFGSVLQYLPDYSKVLLSMINKNPEYIFITDNFMGKHPTFATAQVNMPERKMAYWIFQLCEIISLFEKNNYILKYKSRNYQPFHHFNNFPVEYGINNSCNLLFKKPDL